MTTVRALDAAEAHDTQCWSWECEARPQFWVVTSVGTIAACDHHVDALLVEQASPSDLVPADLATATEEIPFT